MSTQDDQPAIPTTEPLPENGDTNAAEPPKRDDIITFGDIDWYIMAEREDKLLLWSVEVVNIMPYNDELLCVTWPESLLQAWLNGPFFNRFDSEIRALCYPANFINNHFIENKFPVTVPSFQELQLFLDPEAYDRRRLACLEGDPMVWWLRNIQGRERKHVCVVYEDGTVVTEGRRWENGSAIQSAPQNLSDLYRIIDYAGVRASIWIDKSIIELLKQREEEARAKAEAEAKAQAEAQAAAAQAAAIGVDGSEGSAALATPGIKAEEKPAPAAADSAKAEEGAEGSGAPAAAGATSTAGATEAAGAASMAATDKKASQAGAFNPAPAAADQSAQNPAEHDGASASPASDSPASEADASSPAPASDQNTPAHSADEETGTAEEEPEEPEEPEVVPYTELPGSNLHLFAHVPRSSERISLVGAPKDMSAEKPAYSKDGGEVAGTGMSDAR